MKKVKLRRPLLQCIAKISGARLCYPYKVYFLMYEDVKLGFINFSLEITSTQTQPSSYLWNSFPPSLQIFPTHFQRQGHSYKKSNQHFLKLRLPVWFLR